MEMVKKLNDVELENVVGGLIDSSSAAHLRVRDIIDFSYNGELSTGIIVCLLCKEKEITYIVFNPEALERPIENSAGWSATGQNFINIKSTDIVNYRGKINIGRGKLYA